MERSGLTEFCRARRTPGRIFPAAQPQMEFTTTKVVPGWASAASTSSAVRASLIPTRVSSSRMGITMISGYIRGSSGAWWCLPSLYLAAWRSATAWTDPPKRLGSAWPGGPSVFFLLAGAFEGEVFDDIVVVLLQLGEQPFVGEIEWP